MHSIPEPRPLSAPTVDGAAGLPLPALLAAPQAPIDAIRGSLRRLEPAGTAVLLETLAHHRIDGLAHRSIARLPRGEVHPWLRASLRRRHQRQAAATLAQGLALADVLDALWRARVPVIVMRGLRTIEMVYRDAGARPFEDHDLLVLPGDHPTARRLLARTGFREETIGLHRRGGVLIDLHTDPLGARRRPTREALLPIDTPALFDRSRPGWVAGSPSLLLDTEDELLLTAVHLVKHSFDRLIRTADLAHLIATHGSSLDWETVRRRTRPGALRRVVAWALEAAARLGARVPSDLLPRGPAGALERLLRDRALDLRPLPYCGDLLLALAAPGWAARARFLIDAFLPAGEAPREGWERVATLPGRTLNLMRQAAWQISSRRKAR